jgi:hypothetical protein
MPEFDLQFPDNMNVTVTTPVTTKIDDEENLCLKIALQLYTYADFEKIQNRQDFAKECLLRATDFVKTYRKFKKSKYMEVIEK